MSRLKVRFLVILDLHFGRSLSFARFSLPPDDGGLKDAVSKLDGCLGCCYPLVLVDFCFGSSNK